MKTIFTSKTMWFCFGQIVFGIVGLISGWIDSGTSTSLIMTGLASIGLRFKTTQPII